MNITRETLKKMAKDRQCIEAAENLFIAKAYYETVYEHLRPLQVEVLEKHQFKVADEQVKKGRKHEVVTNPDRLHLISDEDFEIYQKEVHEIYLNEGYNVNFGYCPVLIAYNQMNDAERNLCDAVEKYTGISHFQLVCSGLDKVREYIELNLEFFAPLVSKKELLHS